VLNSANTPNAAAAGVAATGLNSFGGILTDDGVHNLSITKAGPGMQMLTGTSNSYHGDTTVTSGTLRLGAVNVLPFGAGKGNVSLVGNTVIFGVAVPGTFDIGGFNQSINGLSGTAGSVVRMAMSSSRGARRWGTSAFSHCKKWAPACSRSPGQARAPAG
jgi:autotransporter-associated beta strand protein